MKENHLEIIILGSGSSAGVPVIGCSCEVCISSNSKNKRLRSSIYIKDLKNKKKFLIDTSPDLRQQLLHNEINDVDYVLYTHTHADHTHGFDDLRTLNFIHKKVINCWLSSTHKDEMIQRFSYAFDKQEIKGTFKPQVKLFSLNESPIKLGGRNIEFISLPHGNTQSTAFRFDNFLYATDFKTFPQEIIESWKNQIDYMVASGVMLEKHPTHSTIDETIVLMNQLKIKKGFITHLSHDIDYSQNFKILPENIHFAYDGLSFKI